MYQDYVGYPSVRYNRAMDPATRVLIQNYQPKQDVIDLVENTKIVILCGVTGAGKNTVLDQLLEKDGFEKIITSTTRAPRENDGIMEQHGRDYYFFTHEQALENISNQEYFEVAVVHEKINGVTADEIRRHHDKHSIAVAQVDYQGVDYYKKYSPSTIAIFLIPPSYDVWMNRLKQRYDTDEDFQAAWPPRRESAIKEFEWALGPADCRILINDDLEVTVEKSRKIIEGDHASTGGRLQAQEILNRLKVDA